MPGNLFRLRLGGCTWFHLGLRRLRTLRFTVLGRFALHRVTPNLGDTTRLLLIMSFSEKPGSVGSVQRIRSLYGKVTDEHRAAAAAPVRADALLD